MGNIAREQLRGEGSGKYPRDLPSEPKINYVPSLEPPPEPSGVGINKKVTKLSIIVYSKSAIPLTFSQIELQNFTAIKTIDSLVFHMLIKREMCTINLLMIL